MKRISLKYVLSILAVLLVNIIVIVLLTQYVGAKVKAEDSDTSESTSSGETTAVFSNLGSRGEEVRQIQTKLKELGYLQGNVDGIYGNQTKQAVTAFQKETTVSLLMVSQGRKLWLPLVLVLIPILIAGQAPVVTVPLHKAK